MKKPAPYTCDKCGCKHRWRPEAYAVAREQRDEDGDVVFDEVTMTLCGKCRYAQLFAARDALKKRREEYRAREAKRLAEDPEGVMRFFTRVTLPPSMFKAGQRLNFAGCEVVVVGLPDGQLGLTPARPVLNPPSANDDGGAD